MGQQGVDVQLSTNAQKLFPFAIECKSRAKQAIYADYEQAEEHAEGTNLQPLVILKQNNKKPLVVMDATWFITYFLGANCENSSNSRQSGEA
jgi:Holliday junction resolvase